MNRTPMIRLLALLGLTGLTLTAAEPQTLFFAKETAEDTTRITLYIDGDDVTGTQSWQPKEEAHGAHGTLSGILTGGGIIQVLYEYTIEGAEQSEEQVLKLEGDKLYIGEGELTEAADGRLNLKEPNKVGFQKYLTRVPVKEPKIGSPERKAIMDAMRAPVSAEIGKAVTFTGNVRATGGWARFQGNVAPADGRKPANEDAAFSLELDFYALLKQDKEGTWKVLHSGFAGDIGVREEAREKYPKAPWVLFE